MAGVRAMGPCGYQATTVPPARGTGCFPTQSCMHSCWVEEGCGVGRGRGPVAVCLRVLFYYPGPQTSDLTFFFGVCLQPEMFSFTQVTIYVEYVVFIFAPFLQCSLLFIHGYANGSWWGNI